MGFFTNLVTVELDATDQSVEATRNIYRTPPGSEDTPYFCWGEGERAPGLYQYASGTIHCDTQLELMPGFPMTQTLPIDWPVIDESFRPISESDAVVFHFVLPQGYIPVNEFNRIAQPLPPDIHTINDRLLVTYPVVGNGAIMFPIRALQDSEDIADFETRKFLHPEERRSLNMKVELNFGFVKFAFG